MRRLLTTIVALVASFAPVSALTAKPASLEEDRLCGPLCLLSVCQKLGVEAQLSEITAMTDYNRDAGTSVLGLYKAAKSMGLCALATKTSVDELVTLKVPAIVYLWSEHCVVVEAKDADTFTITEPSGKVYLSPKDALREGYCGFALLVSKDKGLLPITSASSGADMRLSKYTWNFGTVYAGEAVTHSISFQNVGKETLHIYRATSSQPGLAAVFPEAGLPPGGIGWKSG